MDLIPFILLSTIIIVIPGPNVLIIISTSLIHGRLRGLQTVAGTSAAMLIQLCLAALATKGFIFALSNGLKWLKWAGVVYLVYLGIQQFLCVTKVRREQASASNSFQRGFLVSLTNPKTILFFSAFLPQFVSSSAEYLPQIALLSAIFWLLAICLDSCYALAAAKLGYTLNSPKFKRASAGVAGFLYLGAGAALATRDM